MNIREALINTQKHFVQNTMADEIAQIIDEMKAEGTSAALGILGEGPVSASTLIALLRHSMNDLDSKIEFLTNKIHSNTADSKAMQRLQSKLHELNTKLTKDGNENTAHNLRDIVMDDGRTALEFVHEEGLSDYLQFQGLPPNYATNDLVKSAEANGVLSKDTFDRYVAAQSSWGGSRKKADNALRLNLDFGDGQVTAYEIRRASSEWQVSHGTHEGSLRLSRNTLQSAVKELETTQATMSGDRELDMIQLQSYIQQRTQMITLTTNAIKSIHDAERSIVNNFR